MHEFTAVVLLGLAVHAFVTLIRRLHLVHARDTAAVWILLSLALGVVTTWVTDYSLFAGWGIRLRALWMGPVATGLMIGATALVWQEVLSVLPTRARGAGEAMPEAEVAAPRPAGARG